MATPLAELLRPERIEDMVGQEHLFKKGSMFQKAISRNLIPNMIFYGPPGVGKTTVANYLNQNSYLTYHFIYDEKNKNLEDKYIGLLDKKTQNMVLDRCFISELVYGPVLRKSCKLNKEDHSRSHSA